MSQRYILLLSEDGVTRLLVKRQRLKAQRIQESVMTATPHRLFLSRLQQATAPTLMAQRFIDSPV